MPDFSGQAIGFTFGIQDTSEQTLRRIEGRYAAVNRRMAETVKGAKQMSGAATGGMALLAGALEGITDRGEASADALKAFTKGVEDAAKKRKIETTISVMAEGAAGGGAEQEIRLKPTYPRGRIDPHFRKTGLLEAYREAPAPPDYILKLPTLQAGGVTKGPTAAVIGEKSQEAVFPLDQFIKEMRQAITEGMKAALKARPILKKMQQTITAGVQKALEAQPAGTLPQAAPPPTAAVQAAPPPTAPPPTAAVQEAAQATQATAPFEDFELQGGDIDEVSGAFDQLDAAAKAASESQDDYVEGSRAAVIQAAVTSKEFKALRQEYFLLSAAARTMKKPVQTLVQQSGLQDRMSRFLQETFGELAEGMEDVSTTGVGLIDVVRNMSRAGMDAVTQYGALTATVAAASVYFAARQEDDWYKVRASMILTEDQFQSYKQAGLDAMRTVGISTQEMNDIVARAAYFKLPIDMVDEFAVTIGMAAQSLGVLGIEAGEAADFVWDGLLKVGISVGRVEHALSGMLVASQLGNIELTQLMNTAKETTDIMNAITLAGGNAEKAFVSLATGQAAYGNAFLESGEAIEFVRKLMDRAAISEIGPQLAYIAKATGKSYQDLVQIVKSGDLTEIMALRVDAMQAITKEQVAAYGSRIQDFTGFTREAVMQVKALGTTGADVRKMAVETERAREAGAALRNQWMAFNKTIGGFVDRLKNIFIPVMMQLGEPLVKIVQMALTPLLWAVRGISGAVSMLPGPLQKVVSAFVGLFLVVTMVTAGMKSATLSTVRNTIATEASNIALVAGATAHWAYVLATAAFVKKSREELAAQLSGTRARIVGTAAKVRDTAVTYAHALAEGIRTGSLWASVKATAVSTWTTVVNTTAKIGQAVATGAATVAQWALNVATYAFPGTWILAAVVGIVAAVAALGYGMWRLIKAVSGVNDVVGLVLSPFTRLWNMLKGIYDFIVNFTVKIGMAFDYAGYVIGTFALRVIDYVQMLPGKVIAYIQSIPMMIAAFFQGEGQSRIGKAVAYLGYRIVDFFRIAFTYIPKMLLELVKFVVVGIPKMLFALVTTLPVIASQIVTGMVNKFVGIVDFIAAIPGKIVGFIETIPGKIEVFLARIPEMIANIGKGTGSSAVSEAFRNMAFAGVKMFLAVFIKLPIALLKLTATMLTAMPRIIWAALKAVPKIFGVLAVAAVQIFLGIRERIRDALLWPFRKLVGLLPALWEKAKAVLDPKTYLSLGQAIFSGLTSLGQKIFKAITWPWRKAVDFIGSIWEGIKDAPGRFAESWKSMFAGLGDMLWNTLPGWMQWVINRMRGEEEETPSAPPGEQQAQIAEAAAEMARMAAPRRLSETVRTAPTAGQYAIPSVPTGGEVYTPGAMPVPREVTEASEAAMERRAAGIREAETPTRFRAMGEYPETAMAAVTQEAIAPAMPPAPEVTLNQEETNALLREIRDVLRTTTRQGGRPGSGAPNPLMRKLQGWEI